MKNENRTVLVFRWLSTLDTPIVKKFSKFDLN